MYRHIALHLTLVTGVAACGSINDQVVVKKTAPRAPDCPLIFAADGKLPDGQAFFPLGTHERLGYINTREDELSPALKAEISRRACAMGGDTVTYEDPKLLPKVGGLLDRHLDFDVLRKLSQAELDANLAQALAISGISDAKVIEKAAFDHDCPVANVTLIKKREDVRTGDYVLDVCGSERRYTRIEYVYKPVVAATPEVQL